MTHGKNMDIETIIETCLAQSQPIRPKDLFFKLQQRNVKISRSQFYRYAKRLSDAGKLKRLKGIWYHLELTNSWYSLKKDFDNVGAILTEIKVGKHRLGDQHPITGNYEQIYDKATIQGIMMLKGAKTMQTAVRMYIPNEYEAFLFTQASVNEEDKLTWQGINYKVTKIDPIYDGYVLSYKIAKLVETFAPWVKAIDW